MTVQCSALTESLVTSELFGHEKGAFTGATDRRIGRFEMAHKGTLFLDEIGDLSLDVQARLLRVLQSKEFERVGGGKETLTSDFRLIAATNRSLEEDVAAQRFRRDLYYRIDVFPLYVPPLRERKEDVPLLARHFLRVYGSKNGQSVKESQRISWTSWSTMIGPAISVKWKTRSKGASSSAMGDDFCCPDSGLSRSKGWRHHLILPDPRGEREAAHSGSAQPNGMEDLRSRRGCHGSRHKTYDAVLASEKTRDSETLGQPIQVLQGVTFSRNIKKNRQRNIVAIDEWAIATPIF